MSSQKKRRVITPHGSSGDDDEEMGEETAPRRMVVTGRDRSTTTTTTQPLVSSSFRKSMKRRHKQALALLNPQCSEHIQSIKGPDDAPDRLLQQGSHEYIWMSQLIDKRYGGMDGCHVFTMGNNDMSQLGLPENEVTQTDMPPTPMWRLAPQACPIRGVSAGGGHSVAVSSLGIPYTWGNPEEGTLGRLSEGDDDDGVKAATPLPVTGFVRRDNGANEDNTITQVAAGSAHCLFLSWSGAVYQCGYYKDVDSGKFSDMGGPGGTPLGFNENPVHLLEMPGNVVDIYTKECFNAALLDDDTIVTWGFGNQGELARSANMTAPDDQGNYDLGKGFYFYLTTGKPNLDIVKNHFLTPKPVIFAGPFIKRSVVAIAAGGCHLLVSARDPGQFHSQLYTAGHNKYGQLGHGDENNRHELTPVKALEDECIAYVAGGQQFSLALSHDGTRLYSFGRADQGQLGIGALAEVGGFCTTPQPVKFEKPTELLNIAAGDMVGFAITTKRVVYTWGFNESWATGHPNVDDLDVFRPRILENLGQRVNEQASLSHVHGVSGGTQHSLMLVKAYRPRGSAPMPNSIPN